MLALLLVRFLLMPLSVLSGGCSNRETYIFRTESASANQTGKADRSADIGARKL